MGKKILLLQLNIKMQDTDIYVNHGLASIAGTLRAEGFDPTIEIINTSSWRAKKWLLKLAESRPILVGISIYSNQWEYAMSIARIIKKEYGLPIIGGGPHCSLFPQSLYSAECFDAFVLGEGEKVIGSLVKCVSEKESLEGFQGVITHKDFNKKVPEFRGAEPSEMDSLASPAYDLYPKKVILNYPGLIFSRGCPYNCSYCCNAVYKKKLGMVKTRFLSPELAIKRTKEFIGLFKPDYLNFDDDTFTKRTDWLRQFLGMYHHSVGLPFNCNARPETITHEICSMLKQSGCKMVALGCESGNEKIRRTVLNRKMSDKKIIDAADIIRNAGLNLSTFNMVGIPGEKWKDYVQTVSLNRRLAPKRVQITVYYPFRGTNLGDICFKQGLVRNANKATSYFAGSVLRLPGFPAWQIQVAHRLFKFLVFLKIEPAKAILELIKDLVKSLPCGYKLIHPWIAIKQKVAK